MVECMLVKNHGVDFLCHYLDNFLKLGPPASFVCLDNLCSCIQLCAKGLRLNPDKLECPLTCLTTLGIEPDSVTLQAQLPQNKRVQIITLLEARSSKQICKWKELESLIGHLHHAFKIAL